LTVETTAAGAILLRPAVLVPVEIYSEKRIREFEENSRIDSKLLAAARPLDRQKRK